MDNVAMAIFMIMWFFAWFLLAGIAIWLVLVIVAFVKEDRKYLDKFYKAMKG